MRICDLTTLYTEGVESGVNTYLREKARYFAECSSIEHVIVAPGRTQRKSRVFDSTLYTVESRALPWNRDHRVLGDHRAVRDILRAEAPTVVEVDSAYYLGRVAASALPGVPIVGFYHVHLPTFIARPGASRFGGGFAALTEHLAWLYTRYCYRYCDRLVVSSPDVCARLQRKGFVRLDYAPLGVNLDLFRPDVTVEDGRPNAADAPVELLSVGRLSHEKDLDLLLRVVELLNRRGSYRLVIVGDGPLRRRLERRAVADRHISFRGWLPYGEDLARAYAAADLFVHPSPNETFGLTVLEALACGTPVVAARRGGPRNLVHERVGALAEPGDERDFARRIEEVLSRRPTPGECRRHAEENYPWPRCFETLRSVYDRALRDRRATSPRARAESVVVSRNG